MSQPFPKLDRINRQQFQQEMRALAQDPRPILLLFSPVNALIVRRVLEQVATTSPLPQDSPSSKQVIDLVLSQLQDVQMDDDTGLVLSPRAAFLLVSVLQYTSRHPELPENVCNLFREIGAAIRGFLAENYPVLCNALDLGWDERYDVPMGNRTQWN